MYENVKLTFSVGEMNVLIDGNSIFNLTNESLAKVQTVWPEPTEIEQGFQILFFKKIQIIHSKTWIRILLGCCLMIVSLACVHITFYKVRKQRELDSISIILPEIFEPSRESEKVAKKAICLFELCSR